MASSLFIVAAKRTAFGTFGGKLKDLSATELAVKASEAAIKASGFAASAVDSVVFGNVSQTSADAAYLARHVGLKAGLPLAAPALTVNRLCGSGFQSVVNACQQIIAKESEVVLAGGTENMSQAPYAVRNVRWGIPLGTNPVQEDTLMQGLCDSHINTPMAITAENLAEQYKLSRQEVDAFALSSQQKWGEAQKAGLFDEEIVPISLVGRKGPESFAVDEHARPDTTLEGLAKLKPVFKKGGVVTAGSASGISDGAGAMIIASGSAVARHGVKPLARIVSWGIAGVDPSIMGIGPVPAIGMALQRAGLTLKDMDLIEVNEAFAAQFLAVAKELDLPLSRTNVHGGAIALGHPLAASGSRILAHLAYELRRRKARYAVGSACIGGGQGIAVVLENAAL
eukprot:gnl/Hemi2/13330_TR4577_c0_g1_i1.p1 gnl/Hemi2/13330_TR4577_c0_g1~~gnl/Hemi2/13330_TR4577_c0_g1_i1.p1  ORF type:complete len:397 (+),score=159.91 gnl/Hemi2/13330_TR4577_c0_g1_i1:60-1250(+)